MRVKQQANRRDVNASHTCLSWRLRRGDSQRRAHLHGGQHLVHLFSDRAKQGPLKKPMLYLNFTDFARIFDTDTSTGELSHSVRLFFENGGA